MKPIKSSFLFFLIFSCLGFNVYAQSIKDSIDYRKLILKPKNAFELTKGYRHFIKSKENNLKLFDTLNAIYDLRLIAIGLKSKGLFYDSEDYAVEALSLLDNINRHDSIKTEPRVALYNHLGLVNIELENYTEAISYFDKVINTSQNSESQNTGIKNRSNAHFKKKNYKKAIEGYLSVLDYSIKNETQLKIARLKDNLGFVQSKVDDPMALINLNEALIIRKKENHYPGIITSFLHLAEYYKDRSDIKKAIEYTNEALAIAKVTKNKHYELSVLSSKMLLSENLEIIEYKNLSDSIYRTNRLFEKKFAATRYDYYKEKERADSSELKREQERSTKIIFQTVGLIILISSMFLYFILKSKHKKEKQQQVYVTESRISKKVHDEVANDVFQVMTKLQSETNSNEHLIDDIEQIYNKTRDISKEHSLVDLKEDFKTILNDLVLSYTTTNTNLIVKGIEDVNWKTISKLKRVTIYKVLQELLINMKKHSKASVVVFTYATDHKKTIINYSDNGIGCELKKGTGLQNVENRIASINGTITFESNINKGFKAKLVV